MTRRHHSSVLLISLVLPVALAAVSLGIVLAWLPELPPTVAMHWGPAGVDGYADRADVPVLPALLGFGLPALLGGIVVVTSRRRFGLGQKILAVASLAIGVLMAVVFIGVVGGQRGLDDARDAPDILPTFLIAFGAAVLSGVVAWFVLPKASRARTALQPAAPLALGADERAVWWGTARLPLPLIAAILVPTVLVAGWSSWSAARQGGPGWLLLLVPVVILLAILGATDFRVRVDATGLRITSVVGLPRWTIPLADVAEAGTTTVDPLSEFGGWGIRFGGAGRIGIITRRGEALEVRRQDGRSLVITVDDAETAAALLTARVTTG